MPKGRGCLKHALPHLLYKPVMDFNMWRKSKNKAFWTSDSGATSIEYGIVASLFAIGAMVAISSFDQSANQIYQSITAAVTAALAK
jgi:Flp pilus assembly pilin Flp